MQAIVLDSSLQKSNLISCESLTHISDINLIRTDTTLDLSQKAEKGMSCNVLRGSLYTETSSHCYLF
ncbi:hypothetical protein AAZX31_08G301800 [Glycine max]